MRHRGLLHHLALQAQTALACASMRDVFGSPMCTVADICEPVCARCGECIKGAYKTVTVPYNGGSKTSAHAAFLMEKVSCALA